MLVNMKEILAVANRQNFAVPAFNVSDYAIFNGLMEMTEELNAPIIIALHPDELNHCRPEMVKGILERIHRSPIPAAVHLDHGATFEQVQLAIQTGFSSVMIDGSALPFEENVKICRKVAEAAHAVNVSVEGELGTIGTADNFGEKGAAVIKYTEPSDAVRFVKETGVDCLAIAIGTCHGIYPEGVDPELKIDLLKEIKAVLPDTPLVLHGGSSNPDHEIEAAAENGVSKINISSDIKVAFFNEMRVVLQNKDLREPPMFVPQCVEAMKKVAAHKVRLFHAQGKASLYFRG